MHCLCRPSRIMSVRINLLDETDFIHEIKDDLPGQALLDVVFVRLNLIETSYFGIRYIDEENQTHWLDPASRISRQLKPKADPYDLYFGVKFYAADPCKLVEEITRYQLFLQVKQDVLQGRLPVAFELAAELGAFVVQSELGDYDQRRHSKGYVSEFRLLPNQSSELETRVAELHQQLKGMSPATAELNYLDKVKWHDMYGVDLHPVLGEDSVEYFLGLTPSGIVVLRNKTTVAHYYWPRIAKVYFKGRYFMLRISDKNNELSTYGFETPRKSACKHLWRCCVEHNAFFRLMRIPPTLPNSPTNTSDIFQLGSRLKCSKDKSSKDSLFHNRSPPNFVRVPSKRQPRRIMDDFLNGCKKSEQFGGSSAFLNAQNLSNYESPYRSTYSIPTSLGINPYHQQSQHTTMPHSQSNYNNGSSLGIGGSSHIQAPDSPRSTRSAPWPRSQQRSLFGNKPSSPRSVRSASTTGGGGFDGKGSSTNNQHHHHHSQHTHLRSSQRDHVTNTNGTTNTPQQQQQRYRSSSIESHSSNDSRSTRRHKHRHRRTSDNESELSRGSGRSARSHHRKHRRSRHRRDSAGSEHDSTRGRSYSGHRSSTARSTSAVGSHSELIDSSSQWREAQRRQQEASLGQTSVQQASVSKSSMVARSLHSNDSHSDTHSHHKSRRHKKNKSPSDRNRLWNSELAKHLQFGLVDTAGMTEDQLREIPYTVVETNSKRSNSNIRIHKSNSKNSVGGKSTGSGNTLTNGSGSISGHGKNRVDRIRGLCYQNSNPNDSNGAKNGSIRSASTVSSRECDRNNGLVRMMSSMSMGDFISPTGSNLSPMENSALRVSHEHTDSGLGADQDYAYSSERSSDSTRYGTNKSSGASSGSHRKSSINHNNIMNGVGGNNNGGGNSSAYNSLMQQTVSNQNKQHQILHHKQQQQQNQQHLNNHHHPSLQHSFHGQRRHDSSSTNSSSSQPKQNYKYSTNLLQQQHQHSHLNNINNKQHFHHNNHHQLQQQTSSSSSQPSSCAAAVNNHTITPMQQHNQQQQQSAQNQQLMDKGGDKSKPSHRLLNYTTFENNQYKFSLNNVFGSKSGNALQTRPLAAGGGSNGSTTNISNNHNNSGIKVGGGSGISSLSNSGNLSNNQMDQFPEWPNTPAAPYYYQGPSSIAIQAKKRDAKSDLGFPTRRITGQCLTKTQLLTGGGHLAPLSGMGYSMSCSQYPGYGSRLHPAKSDLFLAYPTTNEYEPPFIYNYKMPQMPEFLRDTQVTQQQQQPLATAYHISGAQTADPSLPPNVYKAANNSSPAAYGGATPATDVMYYQFDNTVCSTNNQPPIVQQPKSLYNTKATASVSVSSDSASPALGPLVFLQHQQTVNGSTAGNTNLSSNVATTSNNSMQQTSSNITNNTIGNDRQTSTTAILTATTTTSSSQSRSTTCSDLEEIDEEPSHNLNDEDDEDLFDGEVSYDEYDDGCNKNNFVNNNEIERTQLVLTKDLNATETTKSSTLTSPTIRHASSLAHHINLDNCYVNNNNNQQQEEEHQQQNLLSPNANSNLKSITNSLSPGIKTIPSANDSLNNKNVITKQPTNPHLVKTSKCNNNAGSSCSSSSGYAASQLHQQNSHHNQQPQQQQKQQLNRNNSPMKRLKQIENVHTNSNINLNSNLNSIQTPALQNTPSPPMGTLYPVLNINNTSISKNQTQQNIVANAATTSISSISQPSVITSCTAITTTTTLALSPPPHSTTRSFQNQLQNQNISSSLEIILSPIIQSSRRAQS